MTNPNTPILYSDLYIWDDGRDELCGRQFYVESVGFGHIEDHNGYRGPETKVVFVDRGCVTLYGHLQNEVGEADMFDPNSVVAVIRNATQMLPTQKTADETSWQQAA